jgi:CheY-like chemotaxis protein
MVCATTFHPTVLVVEDDGLVRIDAADTLREAGFDVIEAEGADEALKVMASRGDIAVLFTDINMPGRMDGVELARRATTFIRPFVWS